jgi:2-C-methyl-D-erythritol 4-phosphate cytidylyltransferase
VAVPSIVGAILPLPMSVADNAAAALTPLAGEAPHVRVLRTMLGAVAEPAAVVVAAAEPLVDDVRESLAAHGLSVAVAVAADPGTRAQCLKAGLDYFERADISPQHVVVHDVGRPLASADLFGRVISALRNGSTVVMPALPLTDSVKSVDEQGSVTGTLDRSVLQIVQYPRGFATDHLARLLTGRSSDEFDELEEVIAAGAPITVVDGDSSAFVAEFPRDAAFVEAIIAHRPSDDS